MKLGGLRKGINLNQAADVVWFYFGYWGLFQLVDDIPVVGLPLLGPLLSINFVRITIASNRSLEMPSGGGKG